MATGAPLFDSEIRNRPLRAFQKLEWNAVARLIANHGRSLDEFRRTSNPYTISAEIEHVATRSLMTLSALETYERDYLVVSVTTHRLGLSPSTVEAPAERLGDVLDAVSALLIGVRRYEEDLAEDLDLPDLWTDWLQAPTTNAIRSWPKDAVFTQEQVAQVRQQALAAVDEIEESPDFTADMRQVFREELEAHLPKAGQRWADWRQGFLGWGMALLLDGVIHSHVVGAVFNSVMSFLSAKAGIPIPPQLLP